MTKGTLTKIIESYNYPEDVPRDYIGASSIGSDCLRQIWYEYTGAPSTCVPNKIRRTWAIGKELEGLVLDWLENCGIELARVWYDLIDSELLYFQGHIDAMWENHPSNLYAIIEVKTAKDASFKVFVKDGARKWNPRYYAQVQAYMGMSGIMSAYILVLNKDNSELMDELITFDPDFYAQLKDKARLIHDAKTPPPRIHGSPLWYACKLCKFNKVCHE